MKKIKNIKVCLMSIVAFLVMIITLISLSIIKVEANDKITELVGAATKIGIEIKKAYSFQSSYYPPITQFPIDTYVFTSSPHYFCIQHGVSYGGQNIDNYLGSSHHNSYQITINKWGGTGGPYTSDMKGDLDTSADYYTTGQGNLTKPSDPSYYGYKCIKTESAPVDSAYTNWIYESYPVTFDCEGGDEQAGLAFLFACYLSGGSNNLYTRSYPTYTYKDDPLQSAVWASWLNSGTTSANVLQTQADAFVKYHTETKIDLNDATSGPNVDVVPNKNVGTTISGSTYKVGPFKMSKYIRAKDYSCPKSNGAAQTLQDAFGGGADVQGTIIKAVAIVSNGSSTKEIEFAVPEPDSTFYIDLSETAINGYDELEDIRFTYQRIHASGNGTKYIGTQYKLNFAEESSEQSSCNYSCQSSSGSGNHGYSRSPGTTSSPYTGTCNHYWYDDCYTSWHDYNCRSGTCNCPKDEDGNRNCTTDHSKPCLGHHVHSGYDNHYSHYTTYLCGHKHQDCYKFDWKYTGCSETAQDGFSGSGVLVNEIIDFTIKVEVPLKTNMKIYKYITKVEHTKAGGTNNLAVPDRSGMTAAQKFADTVKIERGDKVTYEVKIVNESRFPTAVKVKDTLPSEISGLIIDARFEYKGSSGSTNPASWIEVPENDEVIITMSLIAESITGTHENKVEFITKNDTPEHMKYVIWGENATHGTHTYGDIVNIDRSREEDSDYYTIKEYDVTIDKYITNVKHATNGISTFSGTGRMKKNNESEKKNNPVYAEFGDIVTYNIDVYNTNEEYMTGSYKDRQAEPFWEPDICYVDIEDTLPKKYSDLKISTSNSSGSISTGTTNFTITNLKVPAGGKVTVTVTLVVEEVTRDTLEENNAKFDGEVRNVNGRIVINHSTKTTTSDWYRINDYNISIDKFISEYTSTITDTNNAQGFTNGEATALEEEQRYDMTESQKAAAPLQAEKTDVVVYTIRVKNDATGSGLKYATQVRPTKVQDVMDAGLTFDSVTGTMYKADGSKKYENLQFGHSNSGNTYYFTLEDKVGSDYLILDPGEWIDYKVKVKITKSNMYLYNLKNTASYTTLTNINNVTGEKDRIVTTENISGQKSSSEYVKLKDLIIAGKVWLDTDKDGYMGINKSGTLVTGTGAIRVEENPTTRVDETKEYAMEGIDVHLYRKDGSLVRSTETDSNGFFTFGRDESLGYYTPSVYSATATGVTESAQRIDKATNKDGNKNYQKGSSELIEYYIEYEYDGLVYRSTPVYSDDTHIKENGSFEDIYKIDSNAAEFITRRRDYNKQHELIAYNSAYGGSDAESLPDPSILEYEKKDHISYIKENHLREMTARTFIDVDAGTTKYLWLKKDENSTETEYLKYINLGLELRDQFDLRLTKDLMSAEVFINGYDMRYDYAQVADSDLYERAEPYYLYYYKSDYNYRYTMYANKKVREAKGEASELKILLNYRIKIFNESPDQTYAKINEIIDYNTETISIKTAKYVTLNDDGTVKTSKDLNIKQTPSFFKATAENPDPGFAFGGYETNFLTWKDDIPVIGQGEEIIIDLVYEVDKTTDGTRTLQIKDPYPTVKMNTAQIFAYSTYEDKGATIPKGLVDCDSNAGNINASCVGVEDTAKYEDNAFRVKVDLQEKEEERQVTGFVFEDTRSEKVDDYKQFVGNGIYDDGEGILNAADAKHQHIADMFKEYGLTIDPRQDLANDTKLDGMTVELVQIINVDGVDYEETIDPSNPGSKENILVRTVTGEAEGTNKGEYKLSSFIPGVYLVRFRYGDMYELTGDMTYNSLLHNGQDYRSTTYTLTGSDGKPLESSNGATTDEAKKAYNTEKYRKLSNATNRVSDARDNELRRIEVMAFSETMTNDVAELLRYTNYLLRDADGKLVQDGDGNYTVVSKGQQIKLNKDTVFKYKLEDLADATNAFADTITVELDVEQREHTEEISTDNYTEENLTFAGNTRDVNLELPNIDFGVSFRPENYLELVKQIKSIKLTTSAGEVLVDVHYDIDGKLEPEKSKGIENVQSINNKDVDGTLTEETQGFRYINVDEDVLQGATISAEYYMFVDNIGEVDTVNKFLVTGEIDDESKFSTENGYSSAVLAEFNKEPNREVIKSENADGGKRENYVRMKELINKTFGITYNHGLFVGDVYYGGKDVDKANVAVVPVKPSKILDLIDNDATFSVQNNSTSGKFWTITNEEELIEKGLIDENRLSNKTNYMDSEGRYYTTYKEEAEVKTYNKNNLAINVPSEGENPTFVKEIYPDYTDKPGATSSHIVIQVDAVLGGDTETEDMVYDNIAEIVEYISPVGRRTNFASTIGNIEVNGLTKAYDAAQVEVDSDGTEIIRLTPPTGLMETELFISGNRNTINILIIAIAVIIVLYIIRFNLKGRIGKSKFYK